MMKSILFILFFFGCGVMGFAQNTGAYVSLAGNAYVTSPEREARITGRGLARWTGDRTVVSVYFYIPQKGTYGLGIRAKGHSKIRVSCQKMKALISLDSPEWKEITVGQFKVSKPGYVKVDLQGIEKTGDTFGEVSDVIVHGVTGEMVYVKDFSTYWGRRGPSVHINYQMPKEPVEWFYNEVTVPKSGEVLASYYMANGFGEGYFGMQFNSPTERRILFSVWSPFDTQDPKKIPDEYKIKLLRKGEGVHIGEFGNEGSGGQSYLKYNWKAGVTYPFLIQVRPDGKGNTVYTAYFYATDEGRWRLIASFQRPKTDTWYKRAHSFLENFSPEQGYLTRWVLFNNQWVRTADGEWKELTEAKFSHDATAGAGVRRDYQGGTEGKKGFYLKNDGFFNEPTPGGKKFVRPASGKQPEIDFGSLEKL